MSAGAACDQSDALLNSKDWLLAAQVVRCAKRKPTPKGSQPQHHQNTNLAIPLHTTRFQTRILVSGTLARRSSISSVRFSRTFSPPNTLHHPFGLPWSPFDRRRQQSATPIRQPDQLVVQELIKIGLALHARHVALAGFGRLPRNRFYITQLVDKSRTTKGSITSPIIDALALRHTNKLQLSQYILA